MGGSRSRAISGKTGKANQQRHRRVNWNVELAKVNRWYDLQPAATAGHMIRIGSMIEVIAALIAFVLILGYPCDMRRSSERKDEVNGGERE